MSAKVKRAENLLGRIGDRLGMTDAGKAFVTGALDPFHDNPIDLKGYPDGNTSANIVQVIKQSMTVTAPPTLAVGATWDCHIVQWPWLDSQRCSTLTPDVTELSPAQSAGSAPRGLASIQASGSGAIVLGGLTALAVPSGLPTSPSSYLNNLSTTQVTTLSIPNTYNLGKRRCVGAGFEVYNTTATLYKGGTVCCYRSPVEDSESAAVIEIAAITGSTLNGSFYTKPVMFEGPPATAAAALLLPDSRQWDAEEGCYVVGALNSENIPAKVSFQEYPIILDHTTPTGASCVGYIPPSVLVPGTTAVGFTSLPCFMTKLDLSGAYFTGLTSQSVLTINWNIQIERMPSNEDLDLVVLAKPAPERDDVAIRFYSHASNSLPVGVRVKENGFGDWFKEVCSTAADYVAPVLSAIPHPGAQGLGMALKGVNSMVNPDRPPRDVVPDNARVATSRPSATPRQAAASSAVKAKNSLIREKNAVTRAKNAEIKARKALKAEKRK